MLASKTQPTQTQAQTPAEKAKGQAQTPKEPAFNPVWARLAFGLQAKLTVGAPDDPHEREADRVADQVMRMPDGPPLQRKCAACEEEEQTQARRKPLSETVNPVIQAQGEGGPAVTHSLSNRLSASQGRGNSMDSQTQSFMSSRFGADFSGVKIHTGGDAAQMNRELSARAFTLGNNIYFNRDQYRPDSSHGKRLLAHELTHTLQQSKQLGTKLIQRDDTVSEHHKGGFVFDKPIEAGAFSDTSSGLNIGGYNYWYQKLKSVYDFNYTTAMSPPLAMGKDAMDAILAKGWELQPSIVPSAGNPAVTKKSALLPVVLGASATTTGTPYRVLCFYNYFFDSTKNKPSFLMVIKDFIPEPRSIINLNESPGIIAKKVPKAIYDRLDEASYSGFPSPNIKQYFTAHQEVKEALASHIEWIFREYKKSNSKGDLTLTEFTRVKENNGGTENMILLRLTTHASPDAGVYYIDLKYYSEQNTSLTADYNKKDYADFMIEEDAKKHPGATEKLGSIRGLDAITDENERRIIKIQAVNYYTNEALNKTSGVMERGFRDTEIDQVFPISTNRSDPSKTEFYNYTFIIHKADVNNLINIDVKRIGKRGDAVVGDPGKPAIIRVPGYAEAAFDANKGETPDKLIKWILARYKGVTEAEIKAATVADVTSKINAIIEAKSGTPDWFKNNYKISILTAADGTTRLKTVHKYLDPDLAGVKEFAASDLKILEISLQRFDLPVLKLLQNLAMVRQEKNIQKPDTLSGLTMGSTYTYNLATKVINAGTWKQTVIIYDSAFNNPDASFLGGAGGINPATVNTITHELGHVVGNRLTVMQHGAPSFQSKFNLFYKELKFTPVTAYAKDTSDLASHSPDTEYFPEAFMLFMSDPEWLLNNQYQTYFWFMYLQNNGLAPTSDQAKSLMGVWEKQKSAQAGSGLAEAELVYALWKEYAVQKAKFPDTDNTDTLVLIISEFQTNKQRPIRMDEIKAIVSKWLAFVAKNKKQPTAPDLSPFFP